MKSHACVGRPSPRKTENKNKLLRFEAAVAGGIPVVKALTEGLAGKSLTRVVGVMNGTCNYILTRMQSSGLSYDEIFKDICIFINLNDIEMINNLIKNYDFNKCIENKKKLINRLNYVKIISENINLFNIYI